MLLLLLSRFSHARLCATPWTAAHQAPLSLGFSRQEHGVGYHFLLQCIKVKSESKVTQSCQILQTPWTAAHQAPRPWDSPGKNTGVGCHFLLQCMKGKSESEVAQSCLTLNDPMDCSPPGSSIHGIFQARVLEWGAIAFTDATC